MTPGTRGKKQFGKSKEGLSGDCRKQVSQQDTWTKAAVRSRNQTSEEDESESDESEIRRGKYDEEMEALDEGALVKQLIAIRRRK